MTAFSLWIGGTAMQPVFAQVPGERSVQGVKVSSNPIETKPDPANWKAFQRLASDIQQDLQSIEAHVDYLTLGIKQTDVIRSQFLQALKVSNRKEAQKQLLLLSTAASDAAQFLKEESQTSALATHRLAQARLLATRLTGKKHEQALQQLNKVIGPNVQRTLDKTSQSATTNVLTRSVYEAAQVLFDWTEHNSPLPPDWKKELEALQTQLEARIVSEVGKTNKSLADLGTTVTALQKVQDAQAESLVDIQKRLAALEEDPSLPPNIQKQLKDITQRLDLYGKRLDAGDTLNKTQDDLLKDVVTRLTKLENKLPPGDIQQELKALKDLVLEQGKTLDTLKETDSKHDKSLVDLAARLKKLEETGPTPPDLAKKLAELLEKVEARIDTVVQDIQKSMAEMAKRVDAGELEQGRQRKQIDGLTKGQTGLADRVTNLENKPLPADLQQKLDALKAKDAQHDTSLTSLSKQLDELAKKPLPPAVETALQSLREALKALQDSDASQTSQLKAINTKDTSQDRLLTDLSKRLSAVEKNPVPPEVLQREVTRIVQEHIKTLRTEITKEFETRLTEQKAELLETVERLASQLDADNTRIQRLDGLNTRLEERVAALEKRVAELEKGGPGQPSDPSYAEAQQSFNQYYRTVCAAEERFASVASYYGLRNFYINMKNQAKAQEMANKLGISARAYYAVVPTQLKAEQLAATKALDKALKEAGNQKARVQILLDQMRELDALTNSHLTVGINKVRQYSGLNPSAQMSAIKSTEGNPPLASLDGLVRSHISSLPQPQLEQVSDRAKGSALDSDWVIKKLTSEDMDAREIEKVIDWLQNNRLDSYGQPLGTKYGDETPLIVRNSGGKILLLKEYLKLVHPDMPWLQ